MSIRYYMRVEAINLQHFVYDTNDISTIRGGSFILLEAINNIARQGTFNKKYLCSISTAASQGLFSFDCDNEDEAKTLEIEVLKFLDKETDGHATFVTAIEPENDNFSLILEKLEAQIHRQQWRIPTVRIPEFVATAQEDFLDGWRPGAQGYKSGDPNISNAKISAATKFRREHGVPLKHQLFHELLGDDKYKDNLCAKSLGELASHRKKGVLDGKIAFIHIDGNNFGSIRRDMCTTRETRELFDKRIQQEFRNPFLKVLLERADNDPTDFQTKDENGKTALRLEVLLWGGDEMTIVVPAWKGWEVLQLFFEQAKSLEFNGVPLSHRATIIFCHNNAPILQIRQLAEKLLSQTKTDIQDRLGELLQKTSDMSGDKEKLMARLSSHEYGDAVHYLVLESFDMLKGSLKNFISDYYQKASYAHLLIYANELKMLRDNLGIIHTNVARSKVLQIIQAIQAEKPDEIQMIIKQVYNLLSGDRLTGVQVAINALTQNDPARWYMVADLWDYIPEWKDL